MPIFNRLIFNKYHHVVPLYYEVLVRLSTGYPSVEGKLHTCYSPIRRSPPKVLLLFVLPLDLHVLGLSLAFILSQDQTLRCKKFVYLARGCYLFYSLTWYKKITFPFLYYIKVVSKFILRSLSNLTRLHSLRSDCFFSVGSVVTPYQLLH